MAEQKVATGTKKLTAAKAVGTVATTAKKTAAKKASATTTEPKQVKKPAVKKVVAVAGEKAPAKKTAVKKVVSAKKAAPTPEERYRMVEQAAYFIAERNGFRGDSTAHWIAAEIEIAAKLGK